MYTHTHTHTHITPGQSHTHTHTHTFNNDLHVLFELGPGALEDLKHHIVLHIRYKVHHLLMNPLETISGKSGLEYIYYTQQHQQKKKQFLKSQGSSTLTTCNSLTHIHSIIHSIIHSTFENAFHVARLVSDTEGKGL
jgi:hypothetical protein